MNYFELYPGDYLRDTTRLSLAEHGAYLRLLMAYYSDEQPLSAENSELFRTVSAMNSAEKKAVLSVADRFFPIGDDGFRHNARADAEIAKAGNRMDSKGVRKSTEAERQQRYRDRRADMFSALARVGIVPEYNIPMDDLTKLVTQNVTQQTVTNVTPSRTSHTATRPQTPYTNNQEQELSPHARSSQDSPASVPTATDAGRACAALRQAGCVRVNPSHPDLLAALAEGVSPEALVNTYRENPTASNPFAWAIATARGRHAEGAKPVTGETHADRPSSRNLSAVERVRAANERAEQREQQPAVRGYARVIGTE